MNVHENNSSHPPLRNPSLRSRLFLYFATLYVITFIAFGLIFLYGVPFTGYKGQLNAIETQVFRTLSAVADSVEGRMTWWLKERNTDIELISASTSIDTAVKLIATPQANATAKRNAINEACEILDEKLDLANKIQRNYQRMCIIDLETKIVKADTGRIGIGEKLAELADCKQQSEDSLIYMTSAPRGNNMTMALCHSLPGNYAGRSYAICLITNLGNVLNGVLYLKGNMGETGEIVLTFVDHGYLFILRGDSFAIHHYDKLPQPARLASEGKKGIVEANDYRNAPVLSAYRHIFIHPNFRMGMVVKQNRSEVLDPLRQVVVLLAAICVAGILMLISISTLISRVYLKPLDDLIRTAKLVERGDLTARCPEGRQLEARMLVRTFNSMVGRLENWQTLLESQVRERTLQLQDANKELERKNSELETFSSLVSHDLKGPLITIQGFVSLLKNELSECSNDDIVKDIEKIDSSAMKMHQMLDDLLELSKIGRIRIAQTDAGLAGIIAEALEMLAGTIESRGVKVDVDDNMPKVRCERPRIIAVFLNLIENAVKYMGDQADPRIVIGACKVNGDVMCYVRDNGIGITPSQSEKIFGMFEKSNPASEGTGVGLALVKQIIENNDGKIWVESNGAEEGSVFYFTLKPAADNASAENGEDNA